MGVSNEVDKFISMLARATQQQKTFIAALLCDFYQAVVSGEKVPSENLICEATAREDFVFTTNLPGNPRAIRAGETIRITVVERPEGMSQLASVAESLQVSDAIDKSRWDAFKLGCPESMEERVSRVTPPPLPEAGGYSIPKCASSGCMAVGWGYKEGTTDTLCYEHLNQALIVKPPPLPDNVCACGDCDPDKPTSTNRGYEFL